MCEPELVKVVWLVGLGYKSANFVWATDVELLLDTLISKCNYRIIPIF